MSESCPFCDNKKELIYETENFMVFPTLGQVVEGYLLIVPKRHIICLGGMTPAEMDEFTGVYDLVGKKLAEAYSRRPIYFEHGIIGQTVRHAHMHAVPADVDLFPRIKKDLETSAHYQCRQISSLKEMHAVFQRAGSYFFYENCLGEKFMFEIFSYPQYLRVLLAEEAGVPERGNWRTMDRALDDRLIADTYRKLAGKFSGL